MRGCEAAFPRPVADILRPLVAAMRRLASQIIALTRKVRDVRFNESDEISIGEHTQRSFIQNVWAMLSGR